MRQVILALIIFACVGLGIGIGVLVTGHVSPHHCNNQIGAHYWVMQPNGTTVEHTWHGPGALNQSPGCP